MKTNGKLPVYVAGFFAGFCALLMPVMPSFGAGFEWQKQDKAVGLMKDGKLVWKFNYDSKLAPKPFFHPVAVAGGAPLTWQSPPDHPWHHALWFSWKYLNKINYWEPNKEGVPDGATEWSNVKVDTRPDYSARIEMDLQYRPQKAEKPVLTEKRVVVISAPAADGSYQMDWAMAFTAGAEDVKLDRTPIAGQPGGVPWGGYAGLSVRFARELKDVRVEATADKGKFENQRYGFSATATDYNGVIDGGEAGLAILDHPSNPRHPTRWYAIADPKQPFWYINAAFLQLEPYVLPAQQTITLRYRLIVHPGRWTSEQLEQKHKQYSSEPATQLK